MFVLCPPPPVLGLQVPSSGNVGLCRDVSNNDLLFSFGLSLTLEGEEFN